MMVWKDLVYYDEMTLTIVKDDGHVTATGWLRKDGFAASIISSTSERLGAAGATLGEFPGVTASDSQWSRGACSS